MSAEARLPPRTYRFPYDGTTLGALAPRGVLPHRLKKRSHATVVATAVADNRRQPAAHSAEDQADHEGQQHDRQHHPASEGEPLPTT